jgi:hypothetical protein
VPPLAVLIVGVFTATPLPAAHATTSVTPGVPGEQKPVLIFEALQPVRVM